MTNPLALIIEDHLPQAHIFETIVQEANFDTEIILFLTANSKGVDFSNSFHFVFPADCQSAAL